MTRRTKQARAGLQSIIQNPDNQAALGDGQNLTLGYAAGLNKDTAQNAFNSADFLQDAADYYYERDGKTFSSSAEVQDYFMSDRRWRNMNTISIGRDLYDANTQSDSQSARLARMQTMFDALPNFYEDGGDGWKGLGENALAAVADPINLIGFGAGGAAAKTAAAKAIAEGSKRAIAKRAGLKAGIKTGAIGEGVASGLVEGIADQGIQRRNVEIGIQDDVSYTQTAAAVGIGAAAGGVLGGLFGAAGAVNPLRKGGKSNIGEGMIMGAKARKEAANIESGRAGGGASTTPEAEEAPARFSAEEKEAVAAKVQQRIDNLESSRVDGNTPDTDPVDLETDVPNNEARKAELAKNRMVGLHAAAEADRTNAKVAYAEGNNKKGAELDESANKKQQKSNDIQSVLERIVAVEDTPADIEAQLDEVVAGADVLLIGYDPEGPKVMGQNQDGSPFRSETRQEEINKKVNIPVKQEGENLTGRTAEQEQADLNEQIVNASVAVREAEDELATIQKEAKPAQERRAAAEEANNAVVQKQQAFERGDEGATPVTPEEVTAAKTELEEATAASREADTKVEAAQTKLNDAQGARKDVMNAQSAETKTAAEQVEATDSGTPLQEAEGADAEMRMDNDDEYTPDNVAENTPPTVTNIVNLLEALGENTTQVRRELKALGDGRKPEIKAKRREYLRGKLQETYARTRMMGVVELVSTNDDSVVFHLDMMRAQILNEAETPEQGEMMVRMYNEFVGNRAKNLFISYLERTSANPVEAMEKLRGKYGDELVEILRDRLGVGKMEINLSDAQEVRDLFKTIKITDQENLMKLEDQLVADFMARDPEFNENTVRSIVYEMTERKLRRDLGKEAMTVQRSDTLITQEVNGVNAAIKELRELRQRILQLKSSIPARQKATMSGTVDAKLQPEDLTTILMGGDAEGEAFIRYAMTSSEPLSEAQQELVDTSRRAAELTSRLGFKGQSIGEAIDKLGDRAAGLEQMRGQDILVYANNQTRTTNDYSVADEYANNALHIGAQRRQGLGTYTSYGKEVKGQDYNKRAQGMLRKANKYGFERKLREFGVKAGVDGRMYRMGSALTAVDQIMRAGIARANNAMTQDPIKQERNKALLDPINDAIKDINGFDGKIKRLQKKIEKGQGDAAEHEVVIEDLNRKRNEAAQQYRSLVDVADMTEADDDVLKALKAVKSRLGRSTNKEAAANRMEVFMDDKAMNLIRQELAALKRRMQQIARRKTRGEDDSLASLQEEEQIMGAIQRLTKQMEKGPTDKSAEKALNKNLKDNIRAEKAAEQILLGEEPPKQDFVGEVPTEVVDKAQAIAGETQRLASAEARFAQRFADLANDESLTSAEKVEAMQRINEEFKAHKEATKPNSNVPTNAKHPPHVVVVDGIEVDVNNDFTYTGTRGGITKVAFDGEAVGTIEVLADKTVLFTKAGGDEGFNARKFTSRTAMRDALPGLVRDRIKAKQEATQKFEQRPNEEGRNYPEPDWSKTETYREETPVPAARKVDPIEEPKVVSDPNNPLTHTVDDFDIPPGRDISVQIVDPESGKIFGQVRVFSRKTKQTVGDVLKASSRFKYVVGSVEAGVKSNSFRAQETFRPLNPDDSFKPAYQDGLVTLQEFDPRMATQSSKVRSKRPTAFNKLAGMSIDQETLSFTPHEANFKIENAADLYEYSVRLDTISWKEMKSVEEFRTYFELRQRVSAELQSRVPNGVRLPTNTMRQSMNNLTKIMDNLNPAETQATVDFMMRIARVNGGKAPIFKEGFGSQTPSYNSTAQRDPFSENNSITVASTGLGRFQEEEIPSTFVVAHEMGHWIYFNMLDEADKLEFWGAMQKYYNEDGSFTSESIKRRANIFGEDSGKISNALSTPQEFFANQFVLWASRSGMVPNLSLWDKVAKMGAKLLDMITGRNQLELDSDLVQLFQRKLPPLNVDPVTGVSNQGISHFAHLASFGKEHGKDGGNKAYVFGKAMADLDIMRADLQTAMATSHYTASDTTTLAETMQTVGRRIYGMIGGKTLETHHPDYGKTKTVIDANGESRLVEQGNARLRVLEDMKSYNRLAKAQYAVHEYIGVLREAGAMRETKDGIIGSLNLADDAEAKIEALISKQYADLESGGSFDAQTAALQALQERSPFKGLETQAIMHLHRLNQELMLAMDDMIKDVSTAYTRQIPRSGKEFVTISIQEGVNKGRMFQSRNKTTRQHQQRYVQEEAKRQEEYWNLKGFVQAVNAERIKNVQSPADHQVTESPKSMDTETLAREGIGLNDTSKRRVDIANELKDRTNTQPKTKAQVREDISDMERQIMDAIVDEESARNVMNRAIEMQNDPEASAMAARIIDVAAKKLHDMGVENPLPVKTPKVSKAIEKVVENKAGMDDDVGVDPGSPEHIKVYSRLITHRDNRTQYVARQLFHRMSVLMGDDMPVSEYNANIMLARDPVEFGDDDLTPIPSSGDLFVDVMKRMRKLSQEAINPESGDINKSVGEIVFHMLPPSEKATISEWAATSGETPSEFYANQVAAIARRGKVTFDSEDGKANWVKRSNQVRRIIKQGQEQAEFIINGLADADGQVMRLAYGDMFAPARQKAPHMNASDAVHRNSVSPVVAGKYASEVVSGMSGKVEQAARDFLGISPSEPMGKHVMFNRSADSEVNGVSVTENGEYGTGVYVERPADVEKSYSPDNFQADMSARIDSAGLNGTAREAAMDAVKKIMGLRERIKMASNGGKGKAHLRDLLYMEDLQWKVLRSFSPLLPDNKVSPLLVRVQNTFDLTSNSQFTITGDTPDSIGHLVADMAEAGLINDRGVRRLIQMLPQNFTGREFHTALTHPEVGVLHLEGSATNSTDALNKVNQFFTDYGFDSISTDNGMVVFSDNNVRHVKNGFTESETAGSLSEKHGGDIKMGGTVAMEMFYRNEPMDKGFAPGVAAELERSGTDAATTKTALKILKGQDLNSEDVERAGLFSSVRNFFTENSRLFRTQGAKWFGDLVKPLNGAGLFERHDVELNSILAPIYKELNKLPGSKNGFSRWARKNVEFINAIGQPASHKRILDALRRGRAQVERLDPQERKVALAIASAFEKELNSLREMGMPVGDARRYGNDFYVPQVWDSEAILANPDRFQNFLREFFVREQNKPDFEGTRKSPGDIEKLVEATYGRMTGEGGILEGTDVLTKALSDPMTTRMLRLSAEDYNGLSEFLVNDLDGLLARYFDRTVRKRQLSAKFGLQGHGFDTYSTVIQSGPEAAAEILMSNQNLVVHRNTLQGRADTENLIIPRLNINREEALDLIRQVKQLIASDEVHGKQKAINQLLNAGDISVRDFPQYRVRVDAIVNALSDFPQGGAPRSLIGKMENFNNVLNKRPIDGSDGSGLSHKFTRHMKAFNSVSLLGFTTLTSIPDIALPLIRSGNMRAFATAWSKYMTDPSYRAAAKNIGVGIENLLHDRMVQMGGEGSQKFTNAFFNFTLLTPWTNMQREVAAMVGFEAFKTEINRAVRLRMGGKKDSGAYKNAVRFLERYGLTGENAQHDFLAPGSYRIDDLPNNEIISNQVKAAMLRFTNEAIFTPNPNDIPMWSQTPWASLMFQLKSFPLMMSRLTTDVLNEAFRHGNPKPLIYLLTAGVGLGMVSVGVKDLVQSRGGEDQRSPEFRKRALSKILPVEEGGDYDERLGWYAEGLMAMGGLGLFAELLYNSSAQLDNGKYGYVRTMSYILGPTVGTSEVAFDVSAGIADGLVGDAEKNSKERQGARQVASRIPVLGGVSAFREGAADLFGEAGSGGKKKGFGQSGSFGTKFGKGKFGE